MLESRDWAPYTEAGLLPSDEPERTARQELLEFLLGHGCSIEEMVEADRRGRLFALAGDRIVRPGARALTLREVAERTGGDEALVRRLWRAIGLDGWDRTDGVASAQDAEALGPIVQATPILGEELCLELARAMGAALARFGEAANMVWRGLSPEGSVATSQSELVTGTYWAANASFLPAVGRALDAFWRHHQDLARDHFERTASWDLIPRRLTRIAVGFVDMSGFTAAAEHLDEGEFARMMSAFSAHVAETVHDLGGRVVKLVGDAAMIVAPTALLLASIVEALMANQTGLELHAGLAQGELLSQDGDYFGSAVNLAARLVTLAEPGTVLATEAVGEALAAASWEVDWQEPRPVRGIADPVTTCVVRPREREAGPPAPR